LLNPLTVVEVLVVGASSIICPGEKFEFLET
jgi:hypothetical protein